MNNKKVVVAHFAQQHSLETAIAVQKAGMLTKYVTTLYNRKGTILYIIRSLISKEDKLKINKKQDNRLPNKKVIQYCEVLTLVLKVLNRIPKMKRMRDFLREYIVKHFNLKVGKYVVKNDIDIFISYDTYCLQSFEMIKKRSPKTKLVIDMSAPYMPYMDTIFLTQCQKIDNALDMESELFEKLYVNCLQRARKELILADYFLVASEFTKQSLQAFGVDSNKIFICPYGLHENYQLTPKKSALEKDKFRCIFVGNVTSKKGIQIFLDVAKKLKNENFEFLVIGQYDPCAHCYQDNKDFVNFKGILSHENVLCEMRGADVLIFPTLADGYGFVVTEALSMGTPVICSKNAGASDVIENYYNGFTVDINDEDAIIEHLIWMQTHGREYEQMIPNAIESVKDITWDLYYKNVLNMLKSI